MKFGIYAPNWGKTFGNPKIVTELAVEAEKAGWDGFFLWDHIIYNDEGFQENTYNMISRGSFRLRTPRIFLSILLI